MPFRQDDLVESYTSLFHQFFYEDIAHSLVRMLIKRYERFSAIMDLGCGSGYATGVLRRKFPHASLIGVDSSLSMLKEAESCHRGVAFRHMPAEALDFPAASFDLVFGNMCYHWFDPGALSKILRVLKPGGILALSFPFRAKTVLGNANTLLLDTYKHLRAQGLDFPKPGRKLGFSIREIYREFKELQALQIAKVFKSEKFPSLEDLLFSLKARGVLHALFDRQVPAAEHFMRAAQVQPTWELTWEIALVLGQVG